MFVKNTHQKAVILMFHLILHVAKEPWFFLEVQYNYFMSTKQFSQSYTVLYQASPRRQPLTFPRKS